MAPRRKNGNGRLTDHFIERAPIGIAIACLEQRRDPGSLRLVRVNRQAARITDMRVARALGKRVDEHLPEVLDSGLAARLAAAAQGNDVVDLGEIRGAYEPGRYYSVLAFPLPHRCVGVLFDDVTDRRVAARAGRELEERFRLIFEASPVAICVFAAQSGALLDINPRFVELLGYRSQEPLIGQPVWTLGMWTAAGEYEGLITELRAARSIREATVVYRTQGGQVRRALVALELMDAEGEERVLAILWRV
jgi:PAS domain S-box-containing protein